MCVDDVVRLGGGTLERMQIFILAEGLNQVEKAVWYRLFVNLVNN